MRRLLYLPIMHDPVDLGSLGPALLQKSVALSGEEPWPTHREVMEGLWDSIGAYLHSLDPLRLKLYQDGLAAGGAVATRIIQEAARRGSRNYQLLLELLNRGAEARQTEDPALLLQEQANLAELVGKESPEGRPHRDEGYLRERDRLMEARDIFIAQAISATLRQEELGVLFIGAYHTVASRLPQDVRVVPLKDPTRVVAYFAALLHGDGCASLQALAQHLTAPVVIPEGPGQG
jgi:hypothetical protein